MVNFKDIESIKTLKQDFDVVFDNPSGKNVMEFLEVVCNWCPLAGDSMESNEIKARDARRQVLATIKTFLKCSPEELHRLGEDAF